MSNSNTNTKSLRDVDIDKEVQSLIKKSSNRQLSNFIILDELKKKFGNEEKIIDAVMDKYQEKMKRVRKLAIKIQQRLSSKYPTLTQKEYVEKISQYKKKYNFDDSEMQTIINLIFSNKNKITNPEVLDTPYSNMSKALGFVPASFNLHNSLNVKPDEMESLQAILTLDAMSKELHNQVILQSLIYQDCSLCSITGEFERSKINIFSFVHPVVVALFLPKINFIDEHMLIASISNIIHQKYRGEELKTQPEYELYYEIATDPADLACVSKPKPFKDLLYRCEVQVKLWSEVLYLRQGKYYSNDLSSFIQAIDNCRASVFDAADLAFVKDEGTILRKLFGAFSMRPTIVVTMPIYGIVPITSHLTPVSSGHITTLSMITVRIPMDINNNAASIQLEDALVQKQLYIHHRQLTVKAQQILYSRELIIFYVHRRFKLLDISRLSRPYGITALPITMSSFDKLQTSKIEFKDVLELSQSGQKFNLKSIVCVETAKTTSKSNEEIIVSCSTIVFTCPELKNANESNAIKYQPLDDCKDVKVVKPITPISWNSIVEDGNVKNDVTAYQFAREKGTLFIYTVEQKDCNDINNSSRYIRT